MVTIDRDKCIGCGLCVKVCVTGRLSIEDGKSEITGDRCLLCGQCKAVCPSGAVDFSGEGLSELQGFSKDHCSIDADTLNNFMAFRRSTRLFTDKPVEKEKIMQILEAGRYTPTGSNKQCLSFVVMQENLAQIRDLAANIVYENIDEIGKSINPATLMRIYDENKKGGDRLFFGAPLAIAVIDRAGEAIDGALAASRMELMANALGLGVCFNGIFARAAKADPRLKERIGVKDDRWVVLAMAIGYPAVRYRSIPARKDLSVTWM